MSSSAIEQPSTSANISINYDTIVRDSLVKDVNLPKTEEDEKEIDAEAEQLLEEIPTEDTEGSLTVDTSDTACEHKEGTTALFGILYCNSSARPTAGASAVTCRCTLFLLIKVGNPSGKGGEKPIIGHTRVPGHTGIGMPSARDCPMGVLLSRHLGIGGHVMFAVRTETLGGTPGGAGSAPD
ncbi:hypothetical protein EVAR_99734_1 [Eumeta japonica]|uniref:Uncharacterized protein n=1 Tax=Eumeta variegata TaxID=151549 RepID=A0A4C1Z729_EUMVA|nr:hypothetical protein EVAR_99734_1 [Eumeta japonica]